MKKMFTKVCAVGIILSGVTLNANAQYLGNSTWAGVPDTDPIVEENFRDWNTYKDAEGFGQMPGAGTDPCANGTDFRNAAVKTITTFDVVRPTAAGANEGLQFAFYLDFCAIQPECDTQSGTNYTVNGNVTGIPSAADNQGPSTTNVSVGSLMIYDNYNTIRPVDQGYVPETNGRGSLTTCKIQYLERVRYATSAYGRERGFHLELGREITTEGVTSIKWDTIRYFGNTGNCYPKGVDGGFDIPADWTGQAKEYFYATNMGWVFDEEIMAENVYLRWRPTSVNAQAVRIHDIKLYGEASPEILNPYRFATSISEVPVGKSVLLSMDGKIVKISEAANVQVFDLLGKSVASAQNVTELDLSALNGNIYIVKAVTATGKTAGQKIVL